jgi:hypothetical protein
VSDVFAKVLKLSSEVSERRPLADGRFLAGVHSAGVTVYDTAANKVMHKIPTPGAVALHFSPGCRGFHSSTSQLNLSRV